ncbi:response regulator [Rhodobacteraceae bacterium 2CG4]|uniref:Response regulator n=1 Tax=Halovulum marinum TaxID=2662447 RepID=A0A6L5Z5V4_9RHOB|nr:response regulator transcription factor [Halovulum marinum]MSU91961.1 response regulator [Halovulum marinum]
MTQRVLIIEDEPNIADALRFLLTREGFDVAVENDGAKALDRLRDLAADVVILDVMLPNRSGFDILRDLRAGGGTAPPVLMLTAKGQAQDRLTAEALGVTAFMTKPFSNAEVVETVRGLAGA